MNRLPIPRRRRSIARSAAVWLACGGSLCLMAAGTGFGCGSAPVFPNALIFDDGSEIHRGHLEEVVNNPDLTEAEKRRILDEEWGIEDADLQDFILNTL